MIGTIKAAILLLLLPLIPCLGVQTALACSCAATQTVCKAFSSADAVFVGTVIKTIGPQTGRWDENRSHVDVQKVYKGSVPKQVIFGWGTTSCDIPMQAGEKWLLYASKTEGSESSWSIGGCGRSRHLREGVEDIKYLESPYKGKPISRLSGSLDYPSGIPLQGVEVEISREGEKRKVKTDEFGFFEIYGLTPGSYAIGPLSTDNWWGFRSSDGKNFRPIGPHEFDRTTDRLTVEVQENSCVETSFRLETQNYIKGVVATEDGSPVTDVFVKASFVGKPGSLGSEIQDCVNEDGVFLFNGVPSGQYILWAESKTLNRPWAPNRFPPVYFPNSFYRRASTPVTVTDNDSAEIQIVVPKIHPVRLLKGSVVYSDGTPAVNEWVFFTFRDGPENRAIETQSDSTGSFRIPITARFRGRLRAEGKIWKYETEECAKLRKYDSKEDFSYTLLSRTQLRSMCEKTAPE